MELLLDKVAHGWGKFEPSIIGLIVGHLPFTCRGVHGNSKTTVAKVLARAMIDKTIFEKTGDTGVRFVSCDKASMVTLAGLPDMESSRRDGEVKFLPAKNTLLGENVLAVVLDEVTRAPKETGNYLLEVVENKTLMGAKLHFKFLMGTMNPETYKGALKLDAALLDRFAAVLPISDLSDVDSNDVEKMIEINMNREVNPNYDNEIADLLRERIEATRAKYKEFLLRDEIRDKVKSYVGQLSSLSQAKIKSVQNEQILSGREMGALLWRAIIAIASYYAGVNNMADGDALVRASDDVLDYSIILKHNMSPDVANTLKSLQKDAQFILRASCQGDGNKVLFAFAKAATPNQKINFWRSHIDSVIKNIEQADIDVMMDSTLEKIEGMTKSVGKIIDTEILKTKAEFYSITRSKKQMSRVVDKIEGGMLCELIHQMRKNNVNPANEPYRSILSKPILKSNEVVDLLISISGGQDTSLNAYVP